MFDKYRILCIKRNFWHFLLTAFFSLCIFYYLTPHFKHTHTHTNTHLIYIHTMHHITRLWIVANCERSAPQHVHPRLRLRLRLRLRRRLPLLVVLTVCPVSSRPVSAPAAAAAAVSRRSHNTSRLSRRLSATPTGADNTAWLQPETGSTIIEIACGWINRSGVLLLR